MVSVAGAAAGVVVAARVEVAVVVVVDQSFFIFRKMIFKTK